MERPRFNDHLEAIKFICKHFWAEVFKKQIDNLKTNHRGTFVLQDNKFRWLSHVSIDPSSEKETEDPSTPGESKAAQAVSMYLYFPCGIIRGVLSNLGIPCDVSADISSLPTYVLESAEIANIIQTNGEASGQKLNNSKSSIVFGNKMEIDIGRIIKRTLDIMNEGGMSSYLSLPEQICGPKKKVFAFVQNRLNERVNN